MAYQVQNQKLDIVSLRFVERSPFIHSHAAPKFNLTISLCERAAFKGSPYPSNLLWLAQYHGKRPSAFAFSVLESITSLPSEL